MFYGREVVRKYKKPRRRLVVDGNYILRNRRKCARQVIGLCGPSKDLLFHSGQLPGRLKERNRQAERETSTGWAIRVSACIILS